MSGMVDMFIKTLGLEPEDFKQKFILGFKAVSSFDMKMNALQERMVRIESKLDFLLDHAGFDVSEINRGMAATQNSLRISKGDEGAGHA